VKHFPTLLAVLASLSACQIDLPEASKIEHMRVLTAIARVEGDSERSSPAPGETASVTWEMAYPDAAQDDSELASMFYVCTAPTRVAGVPFCQEFVDLAQSGGQAGFAGLGAAGAAGLDVPDCGKDPDRVWDVGPFSVVCVTGTPKLDIHVADGFKADAKLMQGIICRNGTPRFDLENPTQLVCDHAKGDKNAEEIAVYGTVPVQQDADSENHNPSTDAAKLQFQDPPVLWDPSDQELDSELNDEACEELVRANRVMSSDGQQEETITLRYDADAREEHAGKPEPLTLSTYTTFGSLSARFTVFRSDAKPPLKRTIKWELSDEERAQVKKTNKYVRFYFTVLDGRGGYAVTRRDLCIVQ
jgi:hypothetical protein